MRITLFVAFTLLLLKPCAAQYTFYKQWDKRYGGVESDVIADMFICSGDSGFLMAGYSKSGISGDKTEPSRGQRDFWALKADKYGNKIWDRRFGTIYDDILYCAAKTLDDGLVLGGKSAGGVDGDKTEPSRGGGDFWVVKLDANGNKQWDKRYGGSSNDALYTIKPTKDGGYICGGISNSATGGDKTQDTWGGVAFYYDYWVVKIDSLGNKQWDRRFGGTDDDALFDIAQISDGGYILAGYSSSLNNGDKSETNMDTTHPLTSDYWIVKIDSTGVKEWDKTIGSVYEDNLRRVIAGNNAECYLAGDGHRFIRMDSLGNFIWDKYYTGSNYCSSIKRTSDQGFLIGGSSTTVPGPFNDKTEHNLGGMQVWVVKTDSFGNKEWDKTVFTAGYADDIGGALETYDGCYVMYTSTMSGIGGYVSEPNRAGFDTSLYDIFIVKLCPFPLTIENQVFSPISLSAYPNPFTNEISITLHKENLSAATFTLTNSNGQIIYTKQETNLSDTYTKMLDLHNLPAGAYFVEITVGEEKMVKQVVKQ